MKKVLLLCRYDEREEYDTQRSMLRKMPAVTDVEFSGADFENLLFDYDGKTLRITDSVSGVDIAEHDAIFLFGWSKTKVLDDVARAVAHYAKAHGIAFANSETYYGRSFTKLSQCVIAALNGVQVTPFVFSLNPDVLLAISKTMHIAQPYIAKAVATSRGRDNYLIQNYAELEKAVREETEPPRYFILQEYIPNNGDYRIIVANGKVRLVIHRQAQEGQHVNNTSQGGKATLVGIEEVPEKVKNDSVKMARLLGRELTGVDMILHQATGEYYFLEANNMPQLSTGSFVPEKMAALSQYLTELAKG